MCSIYIVWLSCSVFFSLKLLQFLGKIVFYLNYFVFRTPGRSPSGAGEGTEKGVAVRPSSTLDSSSSESVDGVDLPHKTPIPHTVLPQVRTVRIFLYSYK